MEESRTAYLRRARHWISNRGLGGFLHHALWQARQLAQGKPLSGVAGPETGPHPFDLHHGVDTTGLIWGESLTSNGSSAAGYWATGYYGIAPSVLETALDRLALPWEDFTFVDIGCGKGRALLLATRYPFRQLLGVELSPTLAAVAQENVERFNPPWRQPNLAITVTAADATTIPLPEGPLLLFLYHPFAAPVMRRFLNHVQAAARSQSREIYLLYTNPELAPMLDTMPGFRSLWQQTSTLTPEEAAADRFHSTVEHTAAYKVQP